MLPVLVPDKKNAAHFCPASVLILLVRPGLAVAVTGYPHQASSLDS